MTKTISLENFQAIHTMIQQDLATSRQLLALLKRESEATQTRSYGDMSQIVTEKAPLLDALKQNAQQRSQWLRALNYPADESNWTKLLQTLNSEEIQQQWQDIKHTIEKCQFINSINGKLINRGVKSHERLLQVMRGQTEQAGIYDARGGKHAATYSGTVAKA